MPSYKTLTLSAILAVANAGCLNPTQFQNNPVTAPSTADYPTIGTPYDITWDNTGEGSTVTLVLLSGCPSNCIVAQTIVAGAPNSGSYSWTPSSSLAADESAEGYGIELIDDSLCMFQWSSHFGLHPAAHQSNPSPSDPPQSSPTGGSGHGNHGGSSPAAPATTSPAGDDGHGHSHGDNGPTASATATSTDCDDEDEGGNGRHQPTGAPSWGGNGGDQGDNGDHGDHGDQGNNGGDHSNHGDQGNNGGDHGDQGNNGGNHGDQGDNGGEHGDQGGESGNHGGQGGWGQGGNQGGASATVTYSTLYVMVSPAPASPGGNGGYQQGGHGGPQSGSAPKPSGEASPQSGSAPAQGSQGSPKGGSQGGPEGSQPAAGHGNMGGIVVSSASSNSTQHGTSPVGASIPATGKVTGAVSGSAGTKANGTSYTPVLSQTNGAAAWGVSGGSIALACLALLFL